MIRLSERGANVLYARCASCGSVVPLFCFGQFMPHPAAYVVATPMGPACGMCGPLRPIFMCSICGLQQYLFVPGAPPPVTPSAGQNFALVVQAQPNASPTTLSGLFGEVASEFAGSFGESAAQVLFGQS
jgi:hypothetical protein